MYSGCNYGSYLFGPRGKRISFRLIRYDDPDNFGSGFDIRLQFEDHQGTVGLARAVGGFGGQTETLTFYRLGSRQAPLCRLVAAEDARTLFEDYRRYVSAGAGGCKTLQTDARIQFKRFT